jgi:hypothetical protein
MPGIAGDGSEDLPNRFIEDKPKLLGICPFCYAIADRMAKNMEGTRYCKNGHMWPNAYSLLAIPSSARPRHAPAENCIYGRCPTCDEMGASRARDIRGTTNCKNGHVWEAYPIKQNAQTEQKPLATEQKLGYHVPYQVMQDILKQLDDLKTIVTNLTK